MSNANIFTSDGNVLDMSKTPDINGKQLIEDPQLETLAEEVISEHNIELGPADVGYMLIYPNISKTRAGKCMKASREVKHFSGHDYLVEISGELWDMLDENTRHVMMFHLHLQMDPTYNEKKREWTMKTRKPDYHAFYEIDKKYGSTWYETIQATVSSLYDLDPKKENKVRV